MTEEQKQALIDEIVIQALRDDVRQWQQRAEAAEAKLAELEKQEPRYFYREHNSYNGMKTDWTEVSAEQLEHLKEIVDPDTAEIIEVFTRPSSAANLADLVPEMMTPEDVRWHLKQSDHDDGPACIIDHAEEVGAKLWNDCRAAILRNIEEAK